MINILDYLEITAEKTAWRTGISDGRICMSWRDLTELSKRVGTCIARNTLPGRPVVIVMSKSVATLAAMFGAVYAGCFYTVIDPAQSDKKIKEIFSVFSPEIVLIETEKEMCRYTDFSDGKIIPLKQCLCERIDMDILGKIRRDICGDDLLYCMITSGSTEKPKGTVVSHRAVVDSMFHLIKTLGITEQERIGNLSPFNMENSAIEIYLCAFTGAVLVLIPQKLLVTPTGLLDYICEKHISALIWDASALAMISSVGGLGYRVPTEVRKIIFSREEMTAMQQLRIWQEALPGTDIINLSGPTGVPFDGASYTGYEELNHRADVLF